jgi:hypothetical protein
MHPFWQKINVECQSCHWWRDIDGRTLDAMTLLTITLIALATIGYLAFLVHYISLDGAPRGWNGWREPPRSHHADAFESHSFL